MKKKNYSLHILAVIAILLGGVFIGYNLKGQKLMTTPSERQVVTMKMNEAIKAKDAMLQGANVLLKVSENAALGMLLTSSSDLTLYTFKNDEPGKSNCYDECAVKWPPFVGDLPFEVGEGINGDIGSINRTDGLMQATYNGMPLYTYDGDLPGSTAGNGVNDLWFVAQP